MADKKTKYYWHGKGAILIGKIDYLRGDEIPHKKIDKPRLEKLMEAGDISTAEVKVEAGASETVVQAQLRELKKSYTKLLNDTKKSAGKDCEACPEKDKRIGELEDDVEEKAALIEKHAGRITELEKQVDDLTKPGGKQ